MAIIPINVYGDKILRQKSVLVKEKDMDKLIPFIKNMWDTMHKANGIGLAANQVSSDKSIFIVDVSDVEGYEKIKPVVFINPKIVEFSDEKKIIEEGCLSLPNLRAEVVRPKLVKIVYYDTDLNEKSIEADELFARVIQHEYDHLQGTYFTDRVSEEMKKKLKPGLQKIKSRDIEIDYSITEKK